MGTPLQPPYEPVQRFAFDRNRLAEALGYLTTGAAEFFSDGDLTVLAHGVRDATLETTPIRQ